MSGLFGSSKPAPLPPMPSPPPGATDLKGAEKKKAKRRYKTILTSPKGDLSTPETERKTLLGE